MKFKVNNKEVFASTGGRPFDKKKPLIIFIHGSGLSHITWVLQTRYFAFHGYSILAIDLPGHGYSEGPALESIEEQGKWISDVIDSVEMKEASLVGHSQGCLIVLECASQFPEKVKSIGLMGGAGAISKRGDFFDFSLHEILSPTLISYEGILTFLSLIRKCPWFTACLDCLLVLNIPVLYITLSNLFSKKPPILLFLPPAALTYKSPTPASPKIVSSLPLKYLFKYLISRIAF